MPKRKFSRKSSKKRSARRRFKSPYGKRKRFSSKKRFGRRAVSVRSVFPPFKRMVFKTNATYYIGSSSSNSIVDCQPGLLTFPWNTPGGAYQYDLSPNVPVEGTPAHSENHYIGLQKFYSNDVANGVYRYAKVYGFQYRVEVEMPTLITNGHVGVSLWTQSTGTAFAPLYPLDKLWDYEGRPFCKVKAYKPGGKVTLTGFIKMHKALGMTKLQWNASPMFQGVQSVAAEASEKVVLRVQVGTGNSGAFDLNNTQDMTPTVRIAFRTYCLLFGDSSNNIARGSIA